MERIRTTMRRTERIHGYQAPKAIASHPGVQECTCGEAGGSDYKHEVWLREGWAYSSGRMQGCRTGFFHTVADFKQANPEKV